MAFWLTGCQIINPLTMTLIVGSIGSVMASADMQIAI